MAEATYSQSENVFYTKSFSVYPKAHFYKMSIDKLGLKTNVVKSDQNIENDVHSDSDTRIFKISYKIASEIPISTQKVDIDTTQIRQLIKSNQILDARKKLNDIIDHNSNEANKAWAIYTLAGIELSGKKYDESIQLFKSIANGEVPASDVLVLRSMRRVAWLLHQQNRKYEAYQAYDELDNFTNHSLTKAVAKMEKCGLLLELARSSKGTFEDCYAYYEKCLQEIPESCKTERGTIALMRLESKYYQKKYSEAIEFADQWLLEFDGQLRDTYMCLTTKALASEALGNWNLSEASFVRILDLPEPDSLNDQFSSKGEIWNMKKRALQWLQKFAEKNGETVKAQLYKQKAESFK